MATAECIAGAASRIVTFPPPCGARKRGAVASSAAIRRLPESAVSVKTPGERRTTALA
jgi:hypothetical protein